MWSYLLLLITVSIIIIMLEFNPSFCCITITLIGILIVSITILGYIIKRLKVKSIIVPDRRRIISHLFRFQLLNKKFPVVDSNALASEGKLAKIDPYLSSNYESNIVPLRSSHFYAIIT